MKDTAYLIIHGYNGGLFEIEYLAEHLLAKGLDVHTVLLAGHGDSRSQLRKSSHSDWIDSVRQAVEILQKEYRQVVFIGFSMGGLIGVHLTSLPGAAGIVFINTPVYYWNLRVVLRDIIRVKCDRIRYYIKSITGVSLKSNNEFLRLLRKTKKMFDGIKIPL